MQERKIRVLHILNELNTGGAERIVFSYFQHIDRNKFQWDFVMTRYADPNKKGILEDEIESMGGHIYRVHRKRENYLKNIKDIDTIIKNGDYDIVHSHLDELSTVYLMSAKWHKVPVRICHSHLAGTERGKGVELLCEMFRPIIYRVTTDMFACGNDAAITLWGKKNVKSGNVYIMKNAIDVNAFTFDEKIRIKKRKELNVDVGTYVIGSVGRLSYQKNSEFIVDVFAKLHAKNSNTVLVLVGTGDLLSRINEKIVQYKLQNCVRVLGNRNDINEIMMALDVFVLPSRFEGLPIVMVEAQCTGLPCYVSDSITKEISLSDDVHYISLRESSENWAVKLCQNSVKESRRIGAEIIENHGYKIDIAAKELEKHYEEILRKKYEITL